MNRFFLLLTLLISVAVGADAAIITQWNFNGNTLTPNIGSGTASLVGGTTSTFAGGNVNNGSSDPVGLGDDAWNTSTYPAQSTANNSAGVQFLFSTAGYLGVIFSFDVRPSNDASRDIRLRYTTDGGANWQNAPGGRFDLAQRSPQWSHQLSYDFTGIAGALNNPDFGVRIVATFQNATQYGSAGPGTPANYDPTGTLRYDMVTVSTPEPSSWWLAGAGLLGLIRLRRRGA